MINGGVHEDLDLTNNSMQRVRFQLEIALRCDFADQRRLSGWFAGEGTESPLRIARLCL
jgi:hypothetical protein